MLKKGNDYFNNDSFWLIAPFKLRDAGTTRSIDAGWKRRLMISYALAEAHPATPIWLVDETIYQKHGECGSVLFLLAYRNQLGRLKTFQNKLKITSHKGILDLKLENVQTGKSIEEINNGIDPFTLIS
jgi:hypothetical protein